MYRHFSLHFSGVSVIFSSGDMGVGPYFGGDHSDDNVRYFLLLLKGARQRRVLVL